MNLLSGPATLLSSDGSVAVLLPINAMVKLDELAPPALARETGGILIGHYDPARTKAIVDEVVGPPSDSRQSAFSFHRGSKGIKETLDRAWHAGRHYLGEWHFHPGPPTASRQDHRSMKEIARSRHAQCASPLLLILGMAGKPRRRCYCCYAYPHGAGPITLEAIP